MTLRMPLSGISCLIWQFVLELTTGNLYIPLAVCEIASERIARRVIYIIALGD